jgi:hypothetical protein
MTVAKTRTEERREIGRTDVAKAGESGMVSLITLRAREIVEKVHSKELEAMGQLDRKALKEEIHALMMHSEAPNLTNAQVEVVPLRCPGDPYEMGKITTLYSALSDCKDYLTMRLRMNEELPVDQESQARHGLY